MIEFWLIARCLTRRRQLLQVVHAHGGMRFARWPEICLNAEMELDVGIAKPHAAADSQCGWLRDFLETQHVAVELARGIFAAGRHRELNVIECKKCHVGYKARVVRAI